MEETVRRGVNAGMDQADESAAGGARGLTAGAAADTADSAKEIKRDALPK